MIDTQLVQYLETEILPRYKAFDKAHRTDHARAVMARSLVLARRYGADQNMAYAIAAYHDVGLVAGRECHHLASGAILASDPALRRWFTADRIDLMREAVEDHRASAAHPPRSLYGRIVAEADRLIGPDTILRRTVQYGLAHYPALDREGHYERLCQHLQHKYAAGGYLQSWLPESENAAGLEALRSLISDSTRIRALFDRIYDEEGGF